MKKSALVIGVSGNESFPALSSVTSQAGQLVTCLEARGFSVSRLINSDATAGAILKYIAELYKTNGSEDITLLYYLGHGFYQNETLWLTTNEPSFEEDVRGKTLIDNQLINISTKLTEFLVSKAGKTALRNLIILDSCHSGSVRLPLKNANASFCCIVSTQCVGGDPQNAIANYGEKKELIFTKQFLSYLNQGTAFSIDELYKNLCSQVAAMATEDGRLQQPSISQSHNFSQYAKETLFKAIQPAKEFEILRNLFIDNACLGLQTSYFFPYAYLLSTEDEYKLSKPLHNVYKEAINRQIDLESFHVMMKQNLKIFQDYELTSVNNKIQAQSYISQYLSINDDSRIRIASVCKLIESGLPDFKNVQNEKRHERLFKIVQELYEAYRNRYFDNRIKSKNGDLKEFQVQNLTNECLATIHRSHYSAWHNFMFGLTETPPNIPFYFITTIQEVVKYLYCSAYQVAREGKDKLTITEDLNFLAESQYFKTIIYERDDEKAQARWMEQLDWAVKKLTLQSVLVPQPVVLVPQPALVPQHVLVPHINNSPEKIEKTKQKIIFLGFLAVALVSFALGNIFSAKSQSSSTSQLKEKVSWCEESGRSRFIQAIIRENKLNCEDVSSVISISLDAESVTNADLPDLVNSFKKLPNLEELDLRENEIADVGVLKKLRLKKLFLSRNKIESIKTMAEKDSPLASSLNILWIDFNLITNLRENVGAFNNLKEMRISNNPLDDSDADFGFVLTNLNGIEKIWAETLGLSEKVWTAVNEAENLRSLYLTNNNIRQIPRINLVRLEELDLSDNRISSDDFDLCDVTKVRKLKLSFNRLKNLSINKCYGTTDKSFKIRELDLSSNEFEDGLIKTITEKSEIFQDLRTLILDSNRIKSLDNLDKLKSITYLKVSNNRLTSIKGIADLEFIKELILFDNQIVYDDDLVNTLKKLAAKNENILTIDMRNNYLDLSLKSSWTELRESFGEFKKIKRIALSGNKAAIDMKDACHSLDKCDL